jgi:arylsulfatase
VPFKFTGKIASITIDLKETKTADHDEAEQARNVSTLKKALAD